MPLRLRAGYFSIFGQKEARKQNLLSGPMYSVSIYFQVKPVRRVGILRPWPVPFLPNLLRPKIQAHFTPLHRACIVEVLSTICRVCAGRSVLKTKLFRF